MNKIWSQAGSVISACKCSRQNVSDARSFTKGLFVSKFDHNPSRLGFFCLRLVWAHARAALELHVDNKECLNFEWPHDLKCEHALVRMTTIPDLSAALQPRCLSLVPCKDWRVGLSLIHISEPTRH
eukprot:407795-Karenia_brevis.AAC.1